MPSFTMELWRVIDGKPGTINEDVYLGLSEYPIYDEAHRAELNSKIKNHYMYQEIGHETVDQFRFRLKTKMNEIMPMYNELYATALIDFDPLTTVDILNTSTGEQEQTASGKNENVTSSDIDSTSKNVASSFPQVMLSGDADYATSGADANSQSKTTANVVDDSTSENKTLSESESRTKGFQGSPAQLIQAARAAILNVDMLIVAELDPLFMAVWNNGDEYTHDENYRK